MIHTEMTRPEQTAMMQPRKACRTVKSRGKTDKLRMSQDGQGGRSGGCITEAPA